MKEPPHHAICPYCKGPNVQFVSHAIEKRDSANSMMAIACSECGSIVSILPLQEIREYEAEIQRRLARIEERIGLTPFEG